MDYCYLTIVSSRISSRVYYLTVCLDRKLGRDTFPDSKRGVHAKIISKGNTLESPPTLPPAHSGAAGAIIATHIKHAALQINLKI